MGARAPQRLVEQPPSRRAGSGARLVRDVGQDVQGLTYQMLAWQTDKLLALEISRNDYTVFVRPELVVEIAFNDLQESPHYPGGLALRFARVKGYRQDKSPAEADTIETLREIYRQSTGHS